MNKVISCLVRKQETTAMLVRKWPGSPCCKSPMSCLLSRAGPLPLFTAQCVHMVECIMQAKPRSNSQPYCFASLWQISLSCGFYASVCACSAHSTCQSPLSFLNEIHWEMRAYLIWSLRGSMQLASLYHTQREEKVAIPARHQILLHVHTHRQHAERLRQTYSDAFKSFMQRERETPT